MRREAIQTAGKPEDWLRGYRDFERLGGMPTFDEIKETQDIAKKWFEHWNCVLRCWKGHLDGVVIYTDAQLNQLMASNENAQSNALYWTGYLCRITNEKIYAEASMHDWLSDPRNAEHRPDDWKP